MNSYLLHESLFRGKDVLLARKSAKILLCGGGALGSWLADLLARQGYSGLSILDMGKVDNINYGTQNFGKFDVGRLKTQQIASNIYRRIGVKVESIHKKLTQNNARGLVKRFDLVLDLFDNMASRKILQLCCHNGTPCLHAGLASMGFFEIKWNSSYKLPVSENKLKNNEPCEYPLASNLVIICVGLIAEVVNRFIAVREECNIEFWLNSMSLEMVRK